MDDEVLMRVPHCFADFDEQCEAPLDVEPLLVAVPRERNTIDELHGEPRTPIGRDAAVDEASDVGMAQAGEDLPLGEKAPVRLDGVETATHELERHALLKLPVGTLGDVDRAHPTARQLDDHAVRPDQSSGLE